VPVDGPPQPIWVSPSWFPFQALTPGTASFALDGLTDRTEFFKRPLSGGGGELAPYGRRSMEADHTVCIYIYMCVFVCVCACMYVYIIYTCAYIYMYIYIYIYLYLPVGRMWFVVDRGGEVDNKRGFVAGGSAESKSNVT